MIYDSFRPISSKIDENYEWLNKEMGIDKSFDVGIRDLKINGLIIHVYYVTGLCDSAYIIELLKALVLLNDLEQVNKTNIDDIVYNRIMHQQVQEVTNLYDVKINVLSGLLGILVEGQTHAYIVDVRMYPGRAPAEPDTEKTVRGSRDGYTENIIHNTALTRRRMKDGRLRNEILRVGRDSKTDVCITYIEGVVDVDLLHTIRLKLQDVKVSELVMSDKKLEEIITQQRLNPFPLVRFTERPDILSSHLYQGYVGIIVDTSPSVIIAPATFFDHLQHVEEYRQAPLIGSFLRTIRIAGIFASMFVVPVWMLFVLQPELLPPGLEFIGPQKEGNVPIPLQILLGEIGLESIRLATIHTPTALSTAMGIVAAILIGQIAIDVGLFSPEVVLYVAASAIGAYATPSYELSLANKVFKLLIIILTATFAVYGLGLYGLITGIVIYILFLSLTRSFGKPYFYPLVPFNFKDLVQVIIRPHTRNITKNKQKS